MSDHLARWGPTRLLRADSGAATDWPRLLDSAESEHTWTVLVADEPGPWAQFACRQADRVLAVVEARAPVTVRPSPARSLELVLLGSEAGTAWLNSWMPRTHYRVTSGSTEDVARLARRIAGRSVGVVLSGGGARGFAHLGVLEVLRHAGIQIDRLGGTSMGAFVASLSASGADESEIRAVLQREFVQRHPFRDYTWPRHSLIRAERARQVLDRVFGADLIEEQLVSLFCVSTDLVGADEVVHRRGRIASAVGKSMSLPGLAPPQRDGSRLHVDGGVLNNLPVDVMVADGEGLVIAVDVMRPFEKGEHATTEAGDRQLPGIVDTIGRSMVLGSWRKAEAARHMAALVVAPRLDGIGMFDFAKLDEIVELGRQAAEAALAAGDIAELLA